MPKNNYFAEFKRYLFELIIIITGISVSFMAQNWREAAADRKLEIQTLERIHADLAADTAAMRATLQLVDLIVRGAKVILTSGDELAANDSLNLFFLTQLNFSWFEKTDIGYQALKQRGGSGLISNKELSEMIIRQYAINYPGYEAWFETDRAFLLDQYMPFFHRSFPYLNDYAGNWEKVEPVAGSDEFRNLLRSNVIIKSQVANIFRTGIASATELMQAIENELDRIGQD